MKLSLRIAIFSAFILVILTGIIYNLKFKFNPDKNIVSFKKSIFELSSMLTDSEATGTINFSGVHQPCSQNPYENTFTNSKHSASFCAVLNEGLSEYKYYGKLNGSTFSDITYKFKSMSTIKKPLSKFNIYVLSNSMILGVPDANENTICSVSSSTGLRYLPEECIGFIDINGTTPPNTEVTCSDGATTLIPGLEFGKEIKKCEPSLNKNYLTDIFPIAFHDNMVEPATTAGRVILVAERRDYVQ